jgi:hypothetical protein
VEGSLTAWLGFYGAGGAIPDSILSRSSFKVRKARISLSSRAGETGAPLIVASVRALTHSWYAEFAALYFNLSARRSESSDDGIACVPIWEVVFLMYWTLSDTGHEHVYDGKADNNARPASNVNEQKAAEAVQHVRAKSWLL